MKRIFFIILIFPAFIFAHPKIEIDTLPKSQVPNPLPQFRIGAQFGYAYRTIPTPLDASAAMKSHLSKLRNNLSYGADVSYFFNKKMSILKNKIGMGIKYNGTYSEEFKTHYIGALLAGRTFLGKNKHCVFGNVGAGYIRYHNDAEIAYKNIASTGNLAAFFAEVGYDFLITQYFAIGLQASFTFGFANHIIDPSRKLQKENLSHLDISIGFRFYQ
jgi:hypothetical protein